MKEDWVIVKTTYDRTDAKSLQLFLKNRKVESFVLLARKQPDVPLRIYVPRVKKNLVYHLLRKFDLRRSNNKEKFIK